MLVRLAVVDRALRACPGERGKLVIIPAGLLIFTAGSINAGSRAAYLQRLAEI